MVRLQGPALVAGTLDCGLLLEAALAALEVFGAEALDLACLVVRAQLHTRWTRAQDAFTRGDGAVMAAASVLY